MLWKGFQRPKRLEFERETLTDRFGRKRLFLITLGVYLVVTPTGQVLPCHGATHITTLHFDTSHNLFVQISGRKKVLLFPPGQSGLLYYPCRDFGLGTATQADAVEVRWPDGTLTKLENVRADQTVSIKQP